MAKGTVARKRRQGHQAALSILALALGLAGPAAAQERTYFRIATGTVSGTYFPIGEAMARVLTQPQGAEPCEEGLQCGVPGVTAVATASEGSIANVELVEAGFVESALTQADIARAAYEGRRMFRQAGAFPSLRAIATLYPEALHLVVRSKSGIARIGHLRGKRVGLDAARSGSNAEARLVLAAVGLDARQVKLSDIAIDGAADQLVRGEIDAFFFMGGWPIRRVTELIAAGDAVLVPIRGSAIDRLVHANPSLVTVAIPEGTYPGSPEVETLGTTALWITRRGMPEPLVHALCRAFWAAPNLAAIRGAHPAARYIDPAFARDSLPIPLHPGAERCYGELGIAEPVPPQAPVTPEGVPIPRKRPATPASPAAIR